MESNRIEKKFVYIEGDDSYKFFLINGMFKKLYPDRKINSLYFDTDDLKNVWDNINCFSNREKIILIWYNELNNSEVYLEQKKKNNLTTIKNVVLLGKFRNTNDLFEQINKEKFFLKSFLLKRKINLKKTVWVSYKRKYFIDPLKKLRITLDNSIKVYHSEKLKKIFIDKSVLEMKYKVNNSSYVNNLINQNFLQNRNQKYSKYVNSFIELNDSGLI